jgi:uncharacterized protein YlxP (DUF503 family)
MYLAAAEIEVMLPTQTLKEKRAVLQGLMDRLRNRFPVAVAEVAEQDNHGLAVIGLVALSGEQAFAAHVRDTALAYLENLIETSGSSRVGSVERLEF